MFKSFFEFIVVFICLNLYFSVSNLALEVKSLPISSSSSRWDWKMGVFSSLCTALWWYLYFFCRTVWETVFSWRHSQLGMVCIRLCYVFFQRKFMNRHQYNFLTLVIDKQDEEYRQATQLYEDFPETQPAILKNYCRSKLYSKSITCRLA